MGPSTIHFKTKFRISTIIHVPCPLTNFKMFYNIHLVSIFLSLMDFFFLNIPNVHYICMRNHLIKIKINYNQSYLRKNITSSNTHWMEGWTAEVFSNTILSASSQSSRAMNFRFPTLIPLLLVLRVFGILIVSKLPMYSEQNSIASSAT